MQNTQDVTATLSDDIKFLITCCKTELSKNDITFIIQSIQHPSFNIQHLLSLANQHGIIPLVYKTLKKLSKENVSPQSQGLSKCTQNLTLEQLLTELKVDYTNIAQRNMLMSAELIRIIKLLEDHGIEALAFKGPILSQMAYGDITLRQYVDLDILVDEADAYEVGKLMSEYGFTSSYPLSILKNKTCLYVDSDFAFTRNTNNILIEMHWRLFRKNIGHHLIFEEFSKDPQTIKMNGIPVKVLSPELHLLYLSLHGSKHAWERVEWISDLDKFIRTQDLNEKKLKETFNLMKANRPILIGLLLTNKLFATPLPQWIKEKIDADNEIDELYETTIDLLSTGFSNMTEMQRARTIYLYQLIFFKNPTEKIKYFFESYLSISRNDCLEFPLPPALNFLYILIKPFRTLRKRWRTKK